MPSAESRVTAAIDAFQDAGVGQGSWETALRRFAEATGSRSGQLIGIGRDWATPFNWVTDLDPEALEEFAAIGGHDPRVNSRVRVGVSGPELAVYDERHFTTEEDCRRNPAYGDVLRRFDVPFLCLTTLLRRDGVLIGLSVNRSRKDGQITEEQRRAFAVLAPHARAAVKTQLALAGQGAAIAAGALAAVGLAAFICDPAGRVLRVSSAAEALLVEGDPLRLSQGRLAAPRHAHDQALAGRIAAAAGATLQPPGEDLVAHGSRGDSALRLQVAPLAQGSPFAPGLVVVTAHPVGGGGAVSVAEAVEVARLRYRLTPAETLVARAMLHGSRPRETAAALAISEATVRTHVRNILTKARARSMLEFVTRLRDA